jgi:hypothetical protein
VELVSWRWQVTVPLRVVKRRPFFIRKDTVIGTLSCYVLLPSRVFWWNQSSLLLELNCQSWDLFVGLSLMSSAPLMVHIVLYKASRICCRAFVGECELSICNFPFFDFVVDAHRTPKSSGLRLPCPQFQGWPRRVGALSLVRPAKNFPLPIWAR